MMKRAFDLWLNVTSSAGMVLAAAIFVLAASFTTAADADVGDKIRIGVLPFDNRAKGVTVEQADIITDIFTRELVQSKTLAVIERAQLQKIGEEQRFEQSALVEQSSAIELGKIAGVQYIILGTVTQLENDASGIAAYGVAFTTDEVTVTVDMRVIDVETAEVFLALNAEGTSKSDAVGFFNENISFIKGKFNGNQASAIANAVTKLAHDVRAVLGGENSHVIAAEAGEVVIDVAAPMEGALYLVYADGKLLKDMSGKPIGSDKIPIAVVRVRDVEYGRSTAVTVPNGGDKNLIRRGDKVEPISSKKAKQLSEGKKFVKSRPKEQSSSFSDILEGGSTASPPTPQAPPATPANAPAALSALEWNDVEGVDRNSETSFKLIDTYPLENAEKNNLGIAHRGACNLYNQEKYKEAFDAFTRLASDYKCDYLSAYWAGMSAMRMKNGTEALNWFNKALEVNPNYKPALDARAKVG